MFWIYLGAYLVGVPMAGWLYILDDVLHGENKPSTYTEFEWSCFYMASLLSWVSITYILLNLVCGLLTLVVNHQLPALKRKIIKLFG